MAITFPSSPSTGQVFTAGNRSWTWDGSSWKGGVASTGDAGTLDGLDSTDFIRSNQSDVALTGGLSLGSRMSVGLTSAESLPYYSNKLVLEVSSQDGITIAANDTSATNYLMFADSTSGNARYRGYIEYNHNTENLAIAQAAIHRLNFSNTEAVFNEPGNSYDFRVESDTITSALYVKGSNGNVGIGTNSPDAKLDIEGNFESSYALKFTNTKGTGKVSGFRSHGVNGESLSLYHDGDRRQMWDSNGSVTFENGDGNDQLYIGATGSVGIGVTAPDSPLHIKKTGANVTLLTLENYQGDINGLGNQGNYIDFKMTDDNETATPQVRIGMHVYDSDGTDSGQPSEGTGNFLIYTMEGTDALGNGNLTEKLRVTEKGNVGIGVTNPSALLHLKSTTNSTGPSIIFENTNNAQAMNIDYYNNAGAVQSRIQYAEGPASWNFIPNTSNGNSALYIAYNGKVGIGTTSPSAPLTIGSGATRRGSYSDLLIAPGGDNAQIEMWGANTSFAISHFDNDRLGIYSNVSSSWNETRGISIKSNGNVGIGITTPSAKLTVAGSVQLGGSDGQNRLIQMGTGVNPIYMGGANVNTINVAHDYNGTYSMHLNYNGYNGGTTQFRDLVINDGKHGNIAEFTGSDKLSKFYGNVDIGGSAGSMKLNVNGSIYLGDNASAATGTYSGRHNIVAADTNIYIVGDGNTSSPSTADKVVIGFGNTANTNYDQSTGASLSSLETPAVTTAEFYTDHAKMLKQLQLLNSASNPSSPKTGAIYYNTTDDVVKVYSGTEWVEVGAAPMNASGGTVTSYTVGGQSYRSHTFTSSGTFTPTTTGTVDLIVVAGGGSGGRDNSGGGGAGGVRQNTNVVVTPTSYSIVVGAGGASNTNTTGGDGGSGFNGGNSSAIGITSLGGGFGGSAGTDNPSGQNRSNGGSGGGGAGNESTASGGSGTAGQGNNGGNSQGSSGGGGGGGAGAVGGNGTVSTVGGLGGIGIQNDYRTGSNIYYGGGGGGGNENSNFTLRAGGSGGGGTGGAGGTNGSANTGGGGGGSTYPSTAASNAGGSGIVVIRYAI